MNSTTSLEFINAIIETGGEVYQVGGSVRDEIMGFGSNPEMDLLVRLIPLKQLVKILNKYGRANLVGASFGIIKFRPQGHDYELDIALPRKEKSTGYGHGDFEVDYDPNLPLEDDLIRRDFTINAIAKRHGTKDYIDPYHGIPDIRTKQIRMLRPEAFDEDPLRILRGIGFVCRFGFNIEGSTWHAMKAKAELIKTVSWERIRLELEKILLKSDQPSQAFKIMQELNILDYIFPELAACIGVAQNDWHLYDVYEHSLRCMDASPKQMHLRLAALLHDIGKPATKIVEHMPEHEGHIHFYGHQKVSTRLAKIALKRLICSNELIKQTTHLIAHHMMGYPQTDKSLRRLISNVGQDNIEDLITLGKADIIASGVNMEERLKEKDTLLARVKDEIEKQNAFSLKDLAINGNDIQTHLHIQPSPIIGQALKYLFAQVIANPATNNKEALLNLLDIWYHEKYIYDKQLNPMENNHGE